MNWFLEALREHAPIRVPDPDQDEAAAPLHQVALESGQRVAADLRLLDAHGLELEEALLTGESLPVLKDAAWIGAPDAGPADCRNMCFAGSTVARGRGHGVVVATGAATVAGNLSTCCFRWTNQGLAGPPGETGLEVSTTKPAAAQVYFYGGSNFAARQRAAFAARRRPPFSRNFAASFNRFSAARISRSWLPTFSASVPGRRWT